MIVLGKSARTEPKVAVCLLSDLFILLIIITTWLLGIFTALERDHECTVLTVLASYNTNIIHFVFSNQLATSA